jgi:DNA-binding NarL/FixJ family response regulator
MIRPTRVLIVDDDVVFRRLLRIVLAVPELEIVGEAGDGVAALEAAQRIRPDLVLMDYNMPLMNGLEAARRMAQSPACPPIVMLTSECSPELCVAARRAGVCDVLSKGISINVIGQAVLAAAGLTGGTLERAA